MAGAGRQCLRFGFLIDSPVEQRADWLPRCLHNKLTLRRPLVTAIARSGHEVLDFRDEWPFLVLLLALVILSHIERQLLRVLPLATREQLGRRDEGGLQI